MNRKLFFGIGFLIWLLATVSFRLAGHVFFRDEEPAILALIWLVTLIAMLGLALLIFRWQGLNRAETLRGGGLAGDIRHGAGCLRHRGLRRVFP